jgi:hypothetical protein
MSTFPSPLRFPMRSIQYMYLTPSSGRGQRRTYVNPVPLRPLFPFAYPFCLKSLLTPVTSPPAVPLGPRVPTTVCVATSRLGQHRTSGSRRALSHSHSPSPPNPTPSRVLGSLERRPGFILHFNLPFLELTRGPFGLRFAITPSGSRTYTIFHPDRCTYIGVFVQSTSVLSLGRPLPLTDTAFRHTPGPNPRPR